MTSKKKSRLAAAVEIASVMIGSAALYFVLTAYGLAERGYYAVGGEGFVPLLPIIYYLAKRIIRDFAADSKGRYRNPPEE